MTFAQLEALAVTPFQQSVQRPSLIAKFKAWTDALRSLNVEAPLWIDGSFLTEKPEPDDIDLVMRCPRVGAQQVGPPNQQQQTAIAVLLDRAYARATYSLDLYILSPCFDLHAREAYWRALLGTCHDGQTAKGFAEVML